MDYEVDDLAVESSDSAFDEGECYLIQTNTLWLFVGRCTEVTKTHLVLEDASWIQEAGRLSDFLNSCTAKSSEFFGERNLRVRLDAIVFDTRIDSVPKKNLGT